MRYVVMFALAIVSVILQCSLCTAIPLFGVQIDLVLLLMAGMIMAEKTLTPLYYFVLCALYMDVLFAEAIGYYTLPYAVAGMFVYAISAKVTGKSMILAAPILVALAWIVKELLSAFIAVCSGYRFDFLSIFLSNTLLGALMLAGLGVVIYLLMKKLCSAGFMRPRRSVFIDELKL